MWRTKNILVLLSLSLVFLLFLITTTAVKGDKIYVDNGESIQDAIDEANDGDTIQINSSTYEENIEIDKTLILTGENKENTVIIGKNSNEDTIIISSSNVVVSNLKIKTHSSASANLPAIYLDHSDNCIVRDCIIEDSKTGIWILSCDGNTIDDNIIKDNDDDGIKITTSSSGNIITGNTIQNNDLRGIYIDQSSSSNTIYKNNFINNNPNARDYGTNNWYSGQEGNTWEDYNDYDSDNDGIGDNPYSKNGVYDLYPLGEFLTTKPEAHIDYITSPAYVDQTVSFSGHGTPTEDIISYQWKIDGTEVSSSNEFTYTFSQAKTYTIYFRVKDDEQWSDWGSEDLTVNPSDEEDPQVNKKPTAYIDYITPNPANKGEKVYFRGYGTDDGDIKNYEWKIDGEVVSNSNEFTYTFSQVKTYTITFRVKDDEQWSEEKTDELNVQGNNQDGNTKPDADAGGPYNGEVDEMISFDGSSSFDPDGDTMTFNWNFGDGSSSTGEKPYHIYRNKGTYNITLTVTDEHGLSDVDTTTITITSKSSNQNNQDDNDNNNGNDKWVIPGFELISLLIGIIVIIVINIKKKR